MVEHDFRKEGTFTVTLSVVLQAAQQAPRVQKTLRTDVTVQSETVSNAFDIVAERAILDHVGTNRRVRGPRPLKIAILNKSTGPIATYAWSFGDGRSSNDRSPSYTYEKPGIYRLNLQLVDQLQRKFGTTQGEQYIVEVTGWRPQKSWRWPFLAGLGVMLFLGWRLSPWQFRRIIYELGADCKKRVWRKWRSDLVIQDGQQSATLKLRRTLCLRKYYILVAQGPVELCDSQGKEVSRQKVQARDSMKIGGTICTMRRLNNSRATMYNTLAAILLITTCVAWISWRWFF
jgi:hypothetical protein